MILMLKINRMRYLFFFMFFPLCLCAQVSSKLTPVLRYKIQSYTNSEENPELHIMVKGDLEEIKRGITDYNGKFRYSFKEYAAITIPLKNLEAFSRNDYVYEIEYSFGKGEVLNDKGRENNNVLPIHSGKKPLIQPYNGEGVVIGIIDTGIDFTHPDFKNDDGTSRVLYFWNQNLATATNTPQPYGYGQEWNNAEINAGQTTQSSMSDHGSHVTGIAAGNGKSASDYTGTAPKADIIFVAYYTQGVLDFSTTVAEAIKYIFEKADSLGKPCVINTSVGTYWGSHDGTDLASHMVDDLLKAKAGRSVVAAAGNTGASHPFHLGYTVTSDTAFTWFKTASINLGKGLLPTLYFELWADTADFNNVKFSLGADKIKNGYSLRGQSAFYKMKDLPLFSSTYDTIRNSNGDILAAFEFYPAVRQNDKYWLQFVMINPDSSDYFFRFSTTGQGKFDVWSGSVMTISEMVAGINDSIPSVSDFPAIVNYKKPDYNTSMVSSWACLPSVITVGNYVNRTSYVDFNGVTQLFPEIQGSLFETSSHGPTRDGRIKPDISAPGTTVLSCGFVSNLTQDQGKTPNLVSKDGLHKRNTGTSMAAPSVAGIAALYLQKCPKADYQEIYDAITKTAKTDTLTGAVPNNGWGHGKADAFAALLSTPVAELSTNDTSVCKEITITTTPTFNAYLWSTGETTSSINVSLPGNYYVISTDASGCKAVSDTSTITVKPNVLNKPILTISGDTVFCDGDSVQFSLPGNFPSYMWNNGKTSETISATKTGFYSGKVFDANGCSASSDTIRVSSFTNPPKPSISQNGTVLISTVGNKYQWYINGMVMQDSSRQKLSIENDGYYKVEVFNANNCSTFSDSLFVVYVGLENTTINNSVALYPNPASESVSLVFSNNDAVQGKLNVYNLTGKSVLFQRINSQDQKTLTVDTSELASGVYFVKITYDDYHSIIRLIIN